MHGFLWEHLTQERVSNKLHQEGNGVYLFIIEGDVEVAGNRLSRRDGIGLWDTKSFKVEITQEATLLLMEVPMR